MLRSPIGVTFIRARKNVRKKTNRTVRLSGGRCAVQARATKAFGRRQKLD